MKYICVTFFSILLALNYSYANAYFVPPDNTLGDDSAYSITYTTTTNQSDADFTYYEVDASGNIAPVYYKYSYEIKPGVISENRIHFPPNMSDIKGSFIRQVATSLGLGTWDCNGYYTCGGAIYNPNSTLNSIKGEFLENSSNWAGGAIYNSGTIDNIRGDFIENASYGVLGYGGAIYNTKTINNISGNFIGNSAFERGGAIDNYGTINNITGNFINNDAFSQGGAINNFGTIQNITGDFMGNSAGYGGAISNRETIKNISGDFIGNSAAHSGGLLTVLELSKTYQVTSSGIALERMEERFITSEL